MRIKLKSVFVDRQDALTHQLITTMPTFIEKIREQTIASLTEKNNKTNAYSIENERKMEEKKDALMIKLTGLYHEKIVTSISRAAINGYSEKYMNFTYEDFKANFPGLGKPSTVLDMWLKEMSNPDSKYLKTDDEEEEDLQCVEGIEWDIWGNHKFTTVFKW